MTVINILLWFLIRKVCYNANAIVGSAYLIRFKPFILCFEISNLLHKSLIHVCFTVFTLFTVLVMNSHLTYSLTAQEFAILFIHILLVPPKKHRRNRQAMSSLKCRQLPQEWVGTLLNVSLFYDIKLSGMSDLEVTVLVAYATCVQIIYYNCPLVPYVSTLVAYSTSKFYSEFVACWGG